MLETNHIQIDIITLNINVYTKIEKMSMILSFWLSSYFSKNSFLQSLQISCFSYECINLLCTLYFYLFIYTFLFHQRSLRAEPVALLFSLKAWHFVMFQQSFMIKSSLKRKGPLFYWKSALSCILCVKGGGRSGISFYRYYIMQNTVFFQSIFTLCSQKVWSLLFL